jgi:hypothetical protein
MNTNTKSINTRHPKLDDFKTTCCTSGEIDLILDVLFCIIASDLCYLFQCRILIFTICIVFVITMTSITTIETVVMVEFMEGMIEQCFLFIQTQITVLGATETCIIVIVHWFTAIVTGFLDEWFPLVI